MQTLLRIIVPLLYASNSFALSIPTQPGWFLEVTGIAPEIPECHLFFGPSLLPGGANDQCDESARRVDGDIWEVCKDTVTLIETGPGAGECHFHEYTQTPPFNGVGHPVEINCDTWCREARG